MHMYYTMVNKSIAMVIVGDSKGARKGKRKKEGRGGGWEGGRKEKNWKKKIVGMEIEIDIPKT